MKTLNRGTVKSVNSLVMKAAHRQAKAWIAMDCICFDSYKQAMSYALKKAWAAVRGEALVFSWEPETVATAILELLPSKGTEGFEVTASVAVEKGADLAGMFSNMLKEAGHLRSWKNQFDWWFAFEVMLPSRMEVLGRSFFIVEFLLEDGSKVYYYAYPQK